jgi:hypothetical protein
MIERPSRREVINPATLKMFRFDDSVFGRAPVARAISPAAIPSAPACTSSRKTPSRPSWASAESAVTAADGSMVPDYANSATVG